MPVWKNTAKETKAHYATMPIGHVNNIPSMQFIRKFPEILGQNLVHYRWLSVSGNSEIMHCGILIRLMCPLLLCEYALGVDSTLLSLVIPIWSCWYKTMKEIGIYKPTHKCTMMKTSGEMHLFYHAKLLRRNWQKFQMSNALIVDYFVKILLGTNNNKEIIPVHLIRLM